MGRVRDILHLVFVGRPNGLRARARRLLGGADAPPRPVRTAAEPPVEVRATPPATDGFKPVMPAADLRPGEVAEAIVDGVPVALCNVEGKFHAVSGVCPHAGGPIGDGLLEGNTVICPYHGWSFDVRDGRCFVNADLKLPIYEAKVSEGSLCVRIRPGS